MRPRSSRFASSALSLRVTRRGSPTLSVIGMLVRPSRLGWSLVHTRCDPQIAIGISGTSAACAIRMAPLLKSLSSKAREMVASGNTPTISPALRAPTAARKDDAPAPRSTGMWCMPRISGPLTRWWNTCSLAMNLTSRPDGCAASPA